MKRNIVAVVACLVIVILLVSSCTEARRRVKKTKHNEEQKQLFVQSKETSPPNFVRLLVMRFIYGLATQMGLEERLSGIFNGAFAPPNADEDYLGFGIDDDDVDVDFGDMGLFDDI